MGKRVHTGDGKGVLLGSSGHARPGCGLCPQPDIEVVVIPLESSWKMKSKNHTEVLGQTRLSLPLTAGEEEPVTQTPSPRL